MTRLKLKHRAKGRAQPQIKNLLKVIRNKKKIDLLRRRRETRNQNENLVETHYTETDSKDKSKP